VKGIKAVSLFASFCVFIPFICGLVTMVNNKEYGDDDEDYLRGKKTFKISLVILIISLGIFIFIPSSDTILKMVIAKNVTYDACTAFPYLLQCWHIYPSRLNICWRFLRHLGEL
jgi:hypothetical protein